MNRIVTDKGKKAKNRTVHPDPETLSTLISIGFKL